MQLFFAIKLNNQRADVFDSYYGPLFYEWLPNGEVDKICKELKTVDVSFWFERRQKHEKGEFSYFDPETTNNQDDIDFSKQKIYDAGTLRGKIILKNATKEIINLINNKQFDNEKVLETAKSIALQVQEFLSKAISVIRSRYGQHWLCPFPSYDIEKKNKGQLEAFFSSINTHFIDRNGKRTLFRPKDGYITLVGEFGDYSKYMSKRDWFEYKNALESNDFKICVVDKLMISIFRRISSYDFMAATFEVITALELTFKNYINNSQLDNTYFEKNKKKLINNLSLKDQVFLAASFNKKLRKVDVIQTMELIQIRNNYAHEGFDKNNRDIKKKILSTIAIINNITEGKDYHFMSSSPGNSGRVN